MLLDKQEEIEILQEKITSLMLQLMEREEKISPLMENIKGIHFLDILLYHIMCLVLQSQVLQLNNQIKSDDSQLSQRFEEVLASQQHSDQLTQKESDDIVDDTMLTKVSSSDHDIISQGKKFVGYTGEKFRQSFLLFCSKALHEVSLVDSQISLRIIYIKRFKLPASHN